jgi:DMSO/TMAO reductase YedYZ molybdopterin-dependent catalytic subunit
MGLAAIEPETWWLDIDGLVDRPARLTLADLAAMPTVAVTAVHECAGSPLAPTEPKRRVGNVTWSGVPLSSVLARTGVRAGASFVWSEGLEWGSFAGMTREPFVKDLPLSKLPDALLATHLNDAPLSSDRGGPVRLVVPGWYGTNSVKWLGHLTLADRRAPGAFTTRFYNDPGADGTVPVWGIAPESILVLPHPNGPKLRIGEPIVLSGWAWAECGVGTVEISIGDDVWRRAELEPQDGFAWQRFSSSWTPDAPGRYHLACRCTDLRGRSQPPAGARNAIHAIEVEVVS